MSLPVPRRWLLAAGLLLLAGAMPALGQPAPVRQEYRVAPLPPRGGESGRVRVSLRITGLEGRQSVRLQMPAWSPGDYRVANHGRNVRDAAATAGARTLVVARPDDHTWEVQTGGAEAVEFAYTLPSTRPGLFSENVRVEERWAFLNGPATFVYVEGRKGEPCLLRVDLPAGWARAVSPLDPLPPVPGGGPRFQAPDYDTLADSPLVLGDVETREFSEAGRPHVVAFFRDHRGMEYDGFAPILRRIVAEQLRLMGGPPYSRYVFFVDVGGPGGGLEHINSCRIGSGRSPAGIAGLASHEFFHLWNVKRIRPEVLGPFDYVQPPRTRNLWFAEGVTSYYGNLSVLRAGLCTVEEYLAGLAATITGYRSNPARRRVTPDESSLRVWEAGNSSGYGGLSYYQAGELIGLCLDLRLRHATQGRSSLDSVMRDLLARHAPPRPGYPEDGIREAVIRAGGAEMGPFYDRLCRTTRELPLAECLAHAGLFLAQGRIAPLPDAPPQAAALREAWLRAPRSAAAALCQARLALDSGRPLDVYYGPSKPRGSPNGPQALSGRAAEDGGVRPRPLPPLRRHAALPSS